MTQVIEQLFFSTSVTISTVFTKHINYFFFSIISIFLNHIIHDFLNRALHGSRFLDKFKSEKTKKPHQTLFQLLLQFTFFSIIEFEIQETRYKQSLKSLELGQQQRLEASVRRCSSI